MRRVKMISQPLHPIACYNYAKNENALVKRLFSLSLSILAWHSITPKLPPRTDKVTLKWHLLPPDGQNHPLLTPRTNKNAPSDGSWTDRITPSCDPPDGQNYPLMTPLTDKITLCWPPGQTKLPSDDPLDGQN